MQADEDVGKIAMAVPLLVCKSEIFDVLIGNRINVQLNFSLLADMLLFICSAKALELFLQDLCDRTYEIILKRGAKTMSSSHL